MRKFMIASALALATTLTAGVGAASADVSVRLGTNGVAVSQHRDYHPRRHYHHRHHARHCFKKRVVSYYHGRKVVKVKTICR